MNGGPSTDPPVNQPEPRPLAPVPPITAGLNFTGVKDWFLKFTNVRQLANADHQERVDGIRVTLALSVMSTVVKGWFHSTIVGGSLTHIKGPDLKLGLVGFLQFVNANKTETTKGRKDEKIFGLKISHVTGAKNKFQGSNRLSNSAVEKAEFMNTCLEYWELRKEVAATFKETIATLNRVHQSVEESIAKCTMECDKMQVDCTEASSRAISLTAKVSTLKMEASTVKTRASADFKVIAGSGAAFLASANWDGDFGSEVKLLSSSLQEFAASISKLG